MKSTNWVGCVVVILAACAGNQGTQPHDMSAADHGNEAANEDAQAAAHAEQFDPAAKAGSTACGRAGCWTSVVNPTKGHREDAEHHRELAAQHRAAAAALAQAEARACGAISEADRDMSPFNHREDFVSVGVLEEETHVGKHPMKRVTGAVVVFRSVPGMTAEWLQQLVDCHLARAAAVGHAMPEMSYCPLMVQGASAKVSSASSGLAIEIRGQDKAGTDEIVRRVQALAQTPPAP